MLSSALLLAAMMPQGPLPQVKINEFVYDHSGTDVDEYIELYNAGTTAVDISGWTIDAEGTTSSNLDVVIPAATPPIPAGGFFLIVNDATGNPSTLRSLADFLVVGAPTGGWLQNGSKDSIMLRDTALNVVDAVTYENVGTGTLLSAEQVEGAGIRGAVNNFGYLAGSLDFNAFARLTDGLDTGDNGRDFRIARATPRAPNAAGFIDVGSVGYVLDAEIAIGGLIAGSTLPNWGASCQDPVLEAYTGGLPPSPSDNDGTGNPLPGSLYARFGCQAANDSIGGSAWLETLPATDLTFEAYVYIETAPTIAGSEETWHIGFQGTSAEFFNLPPTVSGGAFAADWDVTGIGLTYVVNDTAATLYLVDYSNGSTDTILASMPAPSGWQRVRVQVSEGVLEAHIGGTPFTRSGTRMAGSTDADRAFGGVYLGYRKFGVTGMSIGRGPSPFYVDSLVISGSNARARCFGVAVDNSQGTPVLGLTGVPHVGNPGFGFSTTGMLPSAPYFQLFGTGFPGDFGIDISLVLPGAVPPGLTLWVDLNLFGGQLLTNGAGVGNFSAPLPLDNNLLGISLWGQAFQTDFGLPFPLPLSSTKAIKVTIGSF